MNAQIESVAGSLHSAHRDVEEERTQAEAIVERCRSLHAQGFLAACDGNISVRLPGGRILLTPSGRNKSSLRSDELAMITIDGRLLSGRPSSEQRMHLAVYRACPTARAVVHAHPPTAVAWSVARPELEELPIDSLPEAIIAAGRIPIVPFALPGTAALGDSLLPYLPAHRLVILARHGGLCWGETLAEACDGIERLEHVATILKLACDLGGLSPLSSEALRALRTLRAQVGQRIL